MQFVLGKIVTLFLSPQNWILVTGLAWLLVRSITWKKRLGYTCLILLLVFTNPWLFRKAALAWEVKPTAIIGKYVSAILPGGISGYDTRGKGYFNRAADRFIQTANIFHEGRADWIIITGGNGYILKNYPPEAIFLRQELIRNGIPANRILVDAASRNTHENALYTKRILDSLNIPGPSVLVTSAMHMRRCKLEFDKAGIISEPYPCNYEVIEDQTNAGSLLLPDLELPGNWGLLLKEWVGYLVARRR